MRERDRLLDEDRRLLAVRCKSSPGKKHEGTSGSGGRGLRAPFNYVHKLIRGAEKREGRGSERQRERERGD